MTGPARLHAQKGATAVEFALIASLFFTMLFGVIEMGRLLWTWNAAVEATRLGARLAAVCDINDPVIKTKMIGRLPSLTPSNITLTYLNPPAAPNSCDSGSCKSVRVALSGYAHRTLIPLLPLTLTLPPFSTTLRKEFMNSASNQVCQ